MRTLVKKMMKQTNIQELEHHSAINSNYEKLEKKEAWLPKQQGKLTGKHSPIDFMKKKNCKL